MGGCVFDLEEVKGLAALEQRSEASSKSGGVHAALSLLMKHRRFAPRFAPPRSQRNSPPFTYHP